MAISGWCLSAPGCRPKCEGCRWALCQHECHGKPGLTSDDGELHRWDSGSIQGKMLGTNEPSVDNLAAATEGSRSDLSRRPNRG